MSCCPVLGCEQPATVTITLTAPPHAAGQVVEVCERHAEMMTGKNFRADDVP